MTYRLAFKGSLCAAAAVTVLAQATLAQGATPVSPLVPSLGASVPGGGVNAAALLLNPENPRASLVAGSGELGGVELYTLGGERTAAWPAGEVVAVDTRARVELGGKTIAVVAALDRKDNQIRLFDSAGTALQARPLAFGFAGEGLCLYQSARDQALYAMVLGADGQIDQWLLFPTEGGQLDGLLVRKMHLSSEAGHCAADDATGDLYVTEDAVGVWKFDADPEGEPTPSIVDVVRFGHITGEAGGAALINGGPGARFLIVANPTGGDFNLYDRDHDDRFVGAFRVDGVDAAAGLSASRAGLGEPFADGLLVVADDRKAGANYRYVAWPAIAKAMGVSVGSAQTGTPTNQLALVKPSVETQPVANDGDAADDPAIWVNPIDPAASLIIGTNKKLGLDVYDLDGRIIQTLPDGKMNNVDLRDGFRLGGKPVTLVTASDRTHKAIAIYVLDPASRSLRNVADGVQATGLGDPYGLCMHRSANGKTYVLINDTDGRMRQWELIARPGGKVTSKLVRDLKFDTQAEGCVADDELGALYVAEEDIGLWRLGADPRTGAAKTMIAAVAGNPALKDDLEGVGLYAKSGGRGYIVVSSQGNNTYALFRRDGNNAYVGSFAVSANAAKGIDGVSETDGLDVTAKAVGPAFRHGLMVAQDGRNVAPPERQNFKLVSWEAIASALNLPLD
ncbi:MAG: phytase [Pseudomonadota bacterium]|uniref:phytase n=1 Tax=unclassified Phenylobacterium TaxID=2640670 RepID=UPI0006F2D043|nr:MULTISPECIES: phytase [unclassified Phenylobacterium]KRB52891.1 3-phytase [Phenylobacterium sp. Root700]MBT9471057.1 phytase [Phenylobacterium sp.]